jgi:predicted DNA binding CopG/RHH family protein
MQHKKDKLFNFRIDDNTLQSIKTAAAQKKIDASKYIRNAVLHQLKKQSANYDKTTIKAAK